MSGCVSIGSNSCSSGTKAWSTRVPAGSSTSTDPEQDVAIGRRHCSSVRPGRASLNPEDQRSSHRRRSARALKQPVGSKSNIAVCDDPNGLALAVRCADHDEVADVTVLMRWTVLTTDMRDPALTTAVADFASGHDALLLAKIFVRRFDAEDERWCFATMRAACRTSRTSIGFSSTCSEDSSVGWSAGRSNDGSSVKLRRSFAGCARLESGPPADDPFDTSSRHTDPEQRTVR